MSETERKLDLEEWLQIRSRHALSRQLLVLDDDAKKLQLVLDHFRKALVISEPDAPLFTDEHPLVIPKQLKQHLGLQYDAVILDCREGLHPNSIYAASGLVLAKGLFVIIAPNPAVWPEYFATHNTVPFSYGDTHTHSYFAEYFRDILKANVSVAWCGSWQDKHGNQLNTELPIVGTAELPSCPQVHQGESVTIDQARITLSSAQKKILNDIHQCWESEKNSCHFVSGNRGRGKTTLLSYICALASGKYCQKLFNDIIICAPTKLQREMVGVLSKNDDNITANIKCIAPDQVENVSSQSLLIIDEASAISPHLLSQLCQSPSHIVLAATTQGYEGSGKGLVYRWLPLMGHKVSYHTLHAPFRWHEGDALEEVINQVFESEEDASLTRLNFTPTLIKLDKREMITRSSLTKAMFSLLQYAHYQFSPNDMLRMLDGQDHYVWIFTDAEDRFNPDKLIGVICTISEGPINESGMQLDSVQLRKQIALGQRRVQGHMSLQALSSTLHESEILCYKVHRVHRIAVAPELQNAGHGSEMLKQLHQFKSSLRIDGFTCSFGLTPSLYCFWNKNGYELCKIGHRVDTSSGTLTGHFVQNSCTLYSRFECSHYAHLNLEIEYLQKFHSQLSALIPRDAESLIIDHKQHAAMKVLAAKKCELFLDGISTYAMTKSALFFILSELEFTTGLDELYKLHQKHLTKEQKQTSIARIQSELLNLTHSA